MTKAGDDASWSDYESQVEAWGGRVRANNAQVERLGERDDGSDFYAPIAMAFRADPTREDDPSLNALLALAQPGETWLDVGAGGGRFALGLARRVRRMLAVEPSEGMRAVLEEVRSEHGIENVDLIAERWPLPSTSERPVAADIVLITHVGYDIEAIGPFLEALEEAARRLCVALLMERAPGAAFAGLWQAVHGESFLPLPALPEFVALLEARGRAPDVRAVGERVWGFDSWEDAIEGARRRLWLRQRSTKEHLLLQLLNDHVTPRDDGGYDLRGAPDRIALVTWEPH